MKMQYNFSIISHLLSKITMVVLISSISILSVNAQWSLEKEFAESLDAIAFSPSQESLIFFSGKSYQYYSLISETKFEMLPLSSITGFPKNWDSIDGATSWVENQVLLFKGNEFVVFNPVNGSVLEQASWGGLPVEWQGQLDAVIHWDKEDYVFFLGGEYVFYNATTQTYGEPDLIQNWEGWPLDWNEGFSAGVNIADGYIYFFKDENFLAYDKAKVAFVKPMAIVGN